MRILFAGSPAIAVPVFEKLCALHLRGGKNDGQRIEIAALLTNPDTPKGRSAELLPTDVGLAAQKFLEQSAGQSVGQNVVQNAGQSVWQNVVQNAGQSAWQSVGQNAGQPLGQSSAFPVLKPQKLDAPTREQISSLKPDLLVTFAYGKIFGPKFLALFPLGGINFHPSLLPKYRGPSPISAAILNRDSETGLSIQKIALEVDSGDIFAQERFQLTGTETGASLGEAVAQKAASMLEDTLFKIAAGKAVALPQNHSHASYCHLVSREDALINWSLSAAEIEARVRAFNPWPLSRTAHREKELFILKADIFKGNCKPGVVGQVLDIDKNEGILIQTGEGILSVKELQYQGKKALFWKDFLNGARDFSGSQLGKVDS